MLYDPKWEEKVDVVGYVLLKAADQLEKYGWCRKIMHLNKASCAVGAIQDVFQSEEDFYESIRRVLKVLGKEVCPLDILNVSTVMHWNDQPERTKEEVIDTFRRAAVSK